MSIQSVLSPLFVEVLLTLGLLLWLATKRGRDFNSGMVEVSRIALREPNWPAPTQQVAYSFSNQFELPVLFYVLTILEIITRHADLPFVVLAWIFVLSRLVHAYVHTTNNVVTRRGMIFGIGALVLIVMWVIFIVRILLGLS
ncbi:MAPEG family protein [Bradyrhizobium sp.]|uniref:MAPEG family protein n=1 Tax=Bradyrhizobium sp. TaxID=376 RepID=UPI002D555093|nr:MAPEG family protein [Bradyrhizobium sp.]HZR73064.1 MAPEG family protein [Bradyrhizobium sp.]